LVNKLIIKTDLKLNVDEFEDEINLKLNRSDFDQFIAQVEMMKELFK